LAALPPDLRILFVDDSADDIDLERHELARDGLSFEWQSAATEPELRRALAQFKPHVVLCDYSIPGFSGRGALAIVKDVAPLTPLLFVSGTIGEETAVECLREGAIDYVLKNNPRRLGSAVRRALAEVEERKRYEERIRYLANYDALTELPNRTRLQDRIEQAIVHASRSPSLVALLAINIDGFRRLNEAFGYAAGDAALRQIAARLQASVRPGDSVARTGPDEFTALISGLARAEDVNPFAWRLLEAVRVPFTVGERAVTVTASAGIAIYPNDGNEPEALMRAAAAAMHGAKVRQRGGVAFAGSADTVRESLQRVMIESALSQALPKSELSMAYQLQHDLSTGKPCGIEALMRWRQGDQNIAPSVFIPVAEETGLIRQIGRWGLREACAATAPLVTSQPRGFVLGVNVSPLQLQEAGFVEAVQGILEETGFPARCLEIELTETALMKAERQVLDVIEGLRAVGAGVAIDDFGTGYSSLSYLSRLPIERLKIDASFVSRMTTDPRDAKIAHSIVSLGHALELKVIAEGVETEEQREMLLRMDCDEVQGYLFSHPTDIRSIEAALG
jgi:diguanylate cyclase (GGDEF)-like protein